MQSGRRGVCNLHQHAKQKRVQSCMVHIVRDFLPFPVIN